jgi:sarcosine oxidase subunit beta
MRSVDDGSSGRAKAADVAVVGAGVIGLSIAHALVAKGLSRVVVYDRSGIAAGASGVQPGGVRHQWSTRLNCRLVLESSAFYRELGDRLGIAGAPVLEPCGYLFLAHESSTLDRLSHDVAMQNALGIPSRLLGPEDLEDVLPELQVDGVLGGTYCSDDGYFDRPQAVVEAFGDTFVRDGGTLEIRGVRELWKDGTGWKLTFDDGSTTTAQHVVVAAGHQSSPLIAPIGTDIPIVAQTKHLFLSDPVGETLLEPLVIAIDRHFAAKHLASGRVLTSDLAASGDPQENEHRWRAHVHACIDELLPRLTYVGLGMRVQGEYDITPDRHPIVGPVDPDGSLWLAAGFSGHGFMIAPAIGRVVAEAIAREPLDPLLESLAFERFAREKLEPELQIV